MPAKETQPLNREDGRIESDNLRQALLSLQPRLLSLGFIGVSGGEVAASTKGGPNSFTIDLPEIISNIGVIKLTFTHQDAHKSRTVAIYGWERGQDSLSGPASVGNLTRRIMQVLGMYK